MKKTANDLNRGGKVQREQWEQREQELLSKDSSGSRSMNGYGNNGNEFIQTINPIDELPSTLPTPEIKRPSYISHSDWIDVNGKKLKPGLYYHDEREKNEIPIQTDEYICSPLTVDAITSSPNGDDFGRLLHFRDSNGQWHEWAMPMHMLKGGGEELRGELLNQGVIFNQRNRLRLVDYIMSEKPKRRIIAASKVGWHGSTFVLPDQVIGKEDVVFQSEIAGESEFFSSGSLEGWKQEIGSLCNGNIPLMVSISTALAGPLLRLVNRHNGGGIHWVGDSSTGKSTAIEVAATIWGPPEFIRSWSATANGLEGVAATRNDTCLILDEINEAFPHEVGKIVYMLMNGQGKQRAGRIGNARKIQRWRIMAISSGEKTLENIMKEAGKQVNAGQIVRLLNIPANFEFGVFSHLHGFSDGRSLADHLKSARLMHYGQVGPAFVRKLIEEQRDLTILLDTITKKFIAHSTENLQKRAAGVFAVIGFAGELAIEYGLLPWGEGSTLEAANIAFTRWQKFQGIGQTEDQKILQALNDFTDRHGDSRFSSLLNYPNEKPVPNRAGWYKDTDKGRVFMFTAGALEEAGGGYNRDRIVDTLIRHHKIIDKDSDRYTKKTRASGGTKNLYHPCLSKEEGYE